MAMKAAHRDKLCRPCAWHATPRSTPSHQSSLFADLAEVASTVLGRLHLFLLATLPGLVGSWPHADEFLWSRVSEVLVESTYRKARVLVCPFQYRAAKDRGLRWEFLTVAYLLSAPASYRNPAPCAVRLPFTVLMPHSLRKKYLHRPANGCSTRGDRFSRTRTTNSPVTEFASHIHWPSGDQDLRAQKTNWRCSKRLERQWTRMGTCKYRHVLSSESSSKYKRPDPNGE
ncbi:hypothetical protein C8Q77DRAFT_386524 [Trametes polyzona]|nr:hypothetical protein C8Q77DRAFT_386524 [Trametes polyzona]